ncbi:major capsid protein [Acinetobacter pollinis]|uniref:major capsid protein n=1 Tax=Acinetobacter pollinis TaxID=2605270 RepID=UPI0018C323E3|nr:major capsid protein [Acinetobacter pollinis]MBF7693963.1 hypothetical protein [Acinetobacter pollinis]MBF7701618.1 hypothetical protein [Acinetobacter pollinis]
MALSQTQVFNDFILPATIETLAQEVEKFNAASGNAITLTTDGFTGDFLQKSFFASLESAQRRVDRYAANTAAKSTDLTQLRADGVKIAGGFGPIRFEPGQLTWLQQPTAQGVEVASTNFAKALLKDQLNTAIAGLVAAVGGNTDTQFKASADLDYSAINNSHAKFGDASGNLIAEIMTGAMYHKLVGQNLTNTQSLFKFDSVRVVDILGKLVVVTDAPALYNSTDSLHSVLSLVQNAAVVYDSSDIISNIETTNGNNRIETTLQVDYSFGLSLKGYAWDQATGGKTPSDAAIATSANWDKTATSVKGTAGVLAIGK